MRKLAAAATVAVALVLSTFALARFAGAQDGEKRILLPVNPFASAAEGDWTCYVTKTIEGGKTTATVVTVDTITNVSEEGVSCATETRKDGKKTTAEPTVYERGRKPTFDAFFGGEGAFDYTQPRKIRVADETKTVAGRAFKCMKVTFMTGGKKPGTVTVWFSDEVKGSGVVAMTAHADDGYEEKGEVAGFGSKGKAEWGKTADEVEKTVK